MPGHQVAPVHKPGVTLCPSKRPGRPGRPSPPPPGIEHGLDETLAGSDVLREYQSPLGALLWQVLHDVLLWASTPQADRERIFQSRAALRRLENIDRAVNDPALENLLYSLSAHTLGVPPGTVSEVASTCARVSEWASKQKRPGTALAYAQAAALVDPTDATLAVSTGLMALELGQKARAESWLRRTVVLSRRTQVSLPYTRALVALARLALARGASAEAHSYFLRALRRSRRSGLAETKGAALHGLLELAVKGHAPEDPDALVRSAMAVYGGGHPAAPALIRAWAGYRYSRVPPRPTVGVPDQPLPIRGRPDERAHLLAVIASEAAAAGVLVEYERAMAEAQAYLARPGGEASPGRTLSTLFLMARAAASAGDILGARSLATRALAIAAAHGVPEEAALIEALLARLEGGGESTHPQSPE